MSRAVSSVTCLGCGCACDDIGVEIDAGRLTSVIHACRLGEGWFNRAVAPRMARVMGREASNDEALGFTAAMLTAAMAPLIYLAPELSCAAQREAVALADGLGAALDSASSASPLAGILGAQEQGQATATLGEIRNRADVLVFWGTDPSERYPRFWSRYAPEPPGRHVPDGRRSRTIVAVDVGGRRGPVDADIRIAVEAVDESAVLALAGRELEHPNAARTDPARTAARQLASAVRSGRYTAVVVDAEADGIGESVAGALLAFVRAVNMSSRGALCRLRGGGNRTGADHVLTWQTGFPVAVDFSRGSPEYRPYDGTAEARLMRGDVDAVLVLGAPAQIPPAVRAQLLDAACVVIGPLAGATDLGGARATIDAGIPGIHESGFGYRMDDVPVRLRAVLDGPPAVATLVRELRRRCRQS